MKALIIVDMLDDFVDGKLANPRAQAIVEPLARLLAHAREEGWVVVFSNDAHHPDDPEMAIWGEHAMEGDPGAQVIEALAPREGEIISPKRHYGAFDDTGLAEQLKALGVDEVVITGQHTHICVRHSSYGALRNGFSITIPRHAVCAFEGVDEDDAFEYLKMAYGAKITTVEELIGAAVAAKLSACEPAGTLGRRAPRLPYPGLVNRLAHETSPYLLQHADNPVDWYPWGDEAFERARAEDKPVLLSVGYAACHWCHVMEHESFEDEETARLMNERFVPVKVDREERPDVDGLYMEAVVTMTGAGGWPMTVFLTPDGRPFYGGTYFPPEPRFNMPSFQQLLLAVSQAYQERRGELEQQADALVGAIREASDRAPASEPLTSELIVNAVSALRAQFDEAHGGFGHAPKFPPASNLELLLRTGREDALEMVRATLDGMAAGGMYDVLGGGFHRYSVDKAWLLPHFEKMLYDNALLAPTYLHAWVVTGDERYRRVAEETLDYMVRDLGLPEGGFASAQDADTDGVEGLTYTWTAGEIQDVLGEPHPEWLQPFEHGRSILRAEVPEDARRRLLEARGRRPQPLRDDKVVTAWNGMALAAFAEAAYRLERQDFVEVALRLAGFLAVTMTEEGGGLLRTYRDGVAKIDGYLEDYAHVANGYIELHWATGDLRWLEEARRLAGRAQAFADTERGGWFVGDHDLVARRKEFDDHPAPSGNSMMAFVALRLARIWGDDELERAAVGAFRLAHPFLVRAPTALGHMLCALDLHFSPPAEVAVVGDSPDLRRAALAGFRPHTVFAFAPEPTDSVPLLAGKGLVDGNPAAYACERFACQAPVTAPDALATALA